MLQELAGVETARVEMRRDRAVVVYDPERVTVERMVAAVREAGYEASSGGR